MKKIKLILLTLIVAMSVNSCKKDYPKDIPNWLEDKIKYCDKNKNDCHGLIIDEYSYQSNIYYELYVPIAAPRPNDYYDYNGNLICSDPYMTGNVSCGSFTSGNLTFKRRIWQEN